MNALKNLLIGALVAVIFNLTVTAHAEKISPYFEWKIKNYDDYAQSNLAVYEMDVDKVNSPEHDKMKNKLLAYDINIGDIDGTRDKLYGMIIKGDYYDATILCETIAIYQKILFGTDFFDENLTELTAKLYLITDEFKTAERKINFLLSNAPDDRIKIRALNLQSDLLNRYGNYSEALRVTNEVDLLLKNVPEKKLSLINQSRKARAYCGLGETQKSMQLTEEILSHMKNDVGMGDIETFAVMSTVAENYLQTKRNDDALKILIDKFQIAREEYGSDNLIILSKIITELAICCFESGDLARGEKFLNAILVFVTRSVDNESNHDAFQMYRAINETAIKYLDGRNVIVLKSELGLAQMNNTIGNIPQSIDRCKKNLPTFKQVFKAQGDETLALMKILSENYLLLGKYADAKKIVEERLTVCKNNFGEQDVRTIASTIELANVCHRTGRYKTANNLLASINVPQNKEIFKENPKVLYDYCFNEIFGERMKGGNIIDYVDSYKACIELEETSFLNVPETITFDLEMLKVSSIIGGASDIADIKLGLINIAKIVLSEYHPKVLEMMNAIAESYIEYGRLTEAKKYANQILKLSREHFDENNLCEWRALITLAKIYRAEKKFDDALELDRQALQIAEKVCGKKSLERLETLDSIASDFAAAGNLNEAVKIRERTLSEYKKILEDTDALTTKVTTNLAENYIATKRYSDAIKLCDETLALQKVPQYAGEQISMHAAVMDLFRIKSSAQKLLGDNVNAHESYKKLIQNYEVQRAIAVNTSSSPESKSRWFKGILPVYKEAATVAASDDIEDTTFAFYYAEFCKGRNLIDRFNDILVAKEHLLSTRDKNILTEYENLLSCAQDVYEYAATINDYNLQLNTETVYLTLYFGNELFKGELRKKYSGNTNSSDAQAIKNSDIWSWDNILKDFDVKKNCQAIPDNACLIEFLKTSEDSLLVTFLRKEGDIQATNILVGKKFFDDCKEYNKHNAKGIANQTNLSSELSEKLMPTLEKFAGSSSYWIISPDAELNLIPFETLIYRNKFLVESKDVSYVPSLTVMNLMKNREQENSRLDRSKELLAMGNAVYGNVNPSTLHGVAKFFNEAGFTWIDMSDTAKELDEVSSLFESKTIFEREQATEKNLWNLNSKGELSKYKYLLFSTHGIFAEEKPEYSSIVLSQQFNDEDNDGYVTIGEWMRYDLCSDLVYLSACESGRGADQAGEGVVGIPYALTVAGNKDTVMSLWKVEVKSTAEFTAAVFEKLSRGQSEVSALNETKREFLKHVNSEYRNPSVWAAFLLYGI